MERQPAGQSADTKENLVHKESATTDHKAGEDVLPPWFRLHRDVMAQLEPLVKGKEEISNEDLAELKKWVDSVVCSGENGEPLISQLCGERGYYDLWDFVSSAKLGGDGDARRVALFLLYGVRIATYSRMANYLVSRRERLAPQDWYHLVGVFLDRCLKLTMYSSSSLEMRMPKDFFNLLLKDRMTDADTLARYSSLFYEAIRWASIQANSFNRTYRENFRQSLWEYETKGKAIYNKLQQRKSLHRKFFSSLRKSDRSLWISLSMETGQYL